MLLRTDDLSESLLYLLSSSTDMYADGTDMLFYYYLGKFETRFDFLDSLFARFYDS